MAILDPREKIEGAPLAQMRDRLELLHCDKVVLCAVLESVTSHITAAVAQGKPLPLESLLGACQSALARVDRSPRYV